MGGVVTLHRDCVLCLEQTSPLNREGRSVVLIAMMLTGRGVNEVHQDLCVKHRHVVDGVVKAIREEQAKS